MANPVGFSRDRSRGARSESLRGGHPRCVSLKPLVKRALKVDTTVTVTVSKPGASSAVKVLTIRARKAPLVETQCQPEGAPAPVAC